MNGRDGSRLEAIFQRPVWAQTNTMPGNTITSMIKTDVEFKQVIHCCAYTG